MSMVTKELIFSTSHLCLSATIDEVMDIEEEVFPETLSFPSEWDCRERGQVTTVRNQGVHTALT